jgi:hypothetical protein
MKVINDCPTGRCGLPGPARGGYKDSEFDDELADLLTSDETETIADKPKTVTDLLPLPIKISERNLEFGYLMGPIAAEIHKGKSEVGGFFTTDLKDGDFSLTDFVVPRNLPVTPGSILIAEHYPQAADELKELNDANGTQRRLSAMFHIHPSLNSVGLGHSGPDDDALDSLVNKMAKVNKVLAESPYTLIESKIKREYGDSGLVLRGDELSDAIVRFVYPDDRAFYNLLKDFGLNPPREGFNKQQFLGKLLDIVDHTTTEPRIVRFATSFVFENDRKGPFVKMQVEEKFALTGKVESFYLTSPKLEVILEGENLPTKDEVRALVKDRIKFPKYNFFNGRRNGKGKNFWPQGGSFFPASEGQTSHVQLSDDDTEIWGEEEGFGEGTPNTAPVTPVKAAYQIPKPEVFTKVDFADLGIDSIATSFAFQSMAYVSQWRDKRNRYSGYLGKVLDKAGEYANAFNNTYTGRVSPAAHVLKGDLRRHVLDLGELVEDGKKTTPPIVGTYKLNNVAENITAYLSKNPDMPTIEFITGFAEAPSIHAKNRLLREYVTQILKEREQAVTEFLKNPDIQKITGSVKPVTI